MEWRILRMNNIKNTIALILPFLLTGAVCYADDWPQFRGPNRDGKSAETGLLKKWPESGPKLLWSVDGLGIGFSSVVVADGFIYTTGMLNGEGFLFAYDLSGNLKWKVSYGPEWQRSHRGTRTIPTVDDSRVYVFSGTGILACFDAKTGEEKWAVDTLNKFEGKNIMWGIAESVLIVGANAICTPGGKDASVVAFDKMTGRSVWTSKGLSERSSYCSPALIEIGGTELIATMLERSVVGLDIKTGKVLWKDRIKEGIGRHNHPVSPLYRDGYIYITAGYEIGGVMYRLSADGTKISKKWEDATLDVHHGGVVLVDGYLYGANWTSNARGDWVCLDWDNGKVMYETRWNGNKGSIIYADGMLYCYDENTGDVALVKASPKDFEIVSSFRVTEGSGKHWAHPAISDGRLYIRHGDALMAYEIKSK
jgi:outer membrane protein assembly factor BamB